MAESKPETVNKPVQVAEKIIHAIIMDVLLESAIKAATVAAPWLGLPVIRQVFRFIAGKFAAFFAAQLERATAFAIIDAQVNQEVRTYQDAMKQLKDAQASGDPDALDKARKAFKDSLGRLIHSNGS